jgi:hypothetical protein
MRQRWKLLLLTALIIILIALIARQSLHIYHNIRQVQSPTAHTRQDKLPSIHHWTTVKELAQKYKMSEHEVFTYLQITPQAGDEDLTLRALKNKYHKTQNQMQSYIKALTTDYARKQGTLDE